MNIIQQAKISGKKVLLRVDFNVPMKGEKITDDNRIKAAIPTIKYLLEKDASRVIILTHLGRPKGHEDEYCLWPIANRLIELLQSSGKYYDCPRDEYRISDKVIMLENIRFHPEEEENDPKFTKDLASKGDIFVNDAFGTCHRAHASTVGIAEILPSYAGFLIQEEIKNLEKLLEGHQSPFTVILGGAKIADKLPVIKNLVSRAEDFLIGGAIASTFLAARRHYLGKSLVEKDAFREANTIWQNLMDESNKNIFLPIDVMLSKSIEKPVDVKIVNVCDLMKDIFPEYFVVDIGPKTIDIFATKILQSRTVFWNGNLGVSEVEEFAKGTKKIAENVSKSSAFTVIGGGDTAAVCNQLHLEKNIDFLSTGGGATLEFLAGKLLPGLKVLKYSATI